MNWFLGIYTSPMKNWINVLLDSTGTLTFDLAKLIIQDQSQCVLIVKPPTVMQPCIAAASIQAVLRV